MTEWEVDCVDQRFDDENFQIGRSNIRKSDGKLFYEVYKKTFTHRADAERVAQRLNKGENHGND